MKLLNRRQCLCPTLPGWLVIALLLGLMGILLVNRAYGFLAPNDPLGGDALVIEGWLADEELVRAKARLEAGNYRLVITTGGPLGQGSFLSEYQSYAQLAQASLQKIGVGMPVVAVPAPDVLRDRTFASALALKRWLVEQHPEIRSFDLLTAGPHARRSLMLFREAFGDEYKIGIISLAPLSYDASRWWISSAGVRSMIGESIAWLYAAVLFSPPGDASL